MIQPQVHDSQPVEVRSWETPGSWVARLPAAGEIPSSKRSNEVPVGGEQPAGPQHEAKPAASSVCPRERSRESRAGWQAAKAMEGTPVPGAGADELPGVRGRGTVGRLSWELERPSSARSLRGSGACRPITGDPGKWAMAERESEGAVVVTTVGTTQPDPSEGPLLHRCIPCGRRGRDECRRVG